MLKVSCLSVLFCLYWVAGLQAQIVTPPASPLATLTQQVGLTDVSVAYSRPAAKGRKVYGGLVPYDQLWRTGANKATKITLSDELTVEGKKLPAGDYALFTIPGKQAWTLIFSSKADQNGSFEYQEADDALRIKVTPQKTQDTYESFTILLENTSETSADVSLLWENTKVSFTLEDTDVDAQVMQQIDQMMSSGAVENYYPYFQSASYYFTHDKDMSKALEWANKAAQLGADKYWVLHLQAKVNAKMGHEEVALEAARRSKELAQEAGNPEYVAFNEKIIRELQQ